MREIKFRAWSKERKVMGQTFNLHEIPVAILTGMLDCEIMQFTGLKDKNGREIFEGDVVTRGGEQHIVQFGKIGYDGSWNGLTGFGFKDKEEAGGNDVFMELSYYDKPEELEIIGNIYSNPELLK